MKRSLKRRILRSLRQNVGVLIYIIYMSIDILFRKLFYFCKHIFHMSFASLYIWIYHSIIFLYKLELVERSDEEWIYGLLEDECHGHRTTSESFYHGFFHYEANMAHILIMRRMAKKYGVILDITGEYWHILSPDKFMVTKMSCAHMDT